MIQNELKELWLNLIVPYYQSADKSGELFEEIIKSYSGKNRYYHTCEHLARMLELSLEYGHRLENIEVVRFAIFYHDIVYKTSRTDNESQSATLASARLKQLNVVEENVNAVVQFILATKKHQLVESRWKQDLAYFLDFDLSVLGWQESEYRKYVSGIRLEYKQFPDFLFRSGRRKVVKSILNKPTIFLTSEFRTRFEMQAQLNLKAELDSLT